MIKPHKLNYPLCSSTKENTYLLTVVENKYLKKHTISVLLTSIDE